MLAMRPDEGTQGTEMKRFAIEVEKVNGYCSCGYREGDIFTCAGLNTPDKAFCGGAYAILFPMQTALHANAAFNFEENPHSKTKLACPDNGHIIFKITLLPEPK